MFREGSRASANQITPEQALTCVTAETLTQKYRQKAVKNLPNKRKFGYQLSSIRRDNQRLITNVVAYNLNILARITI